MFKITDPFAYYKSGTLKTLDTSENVGTFLAKYQVTYDENVSLASGTVDKGSPADKRVYILSCTQRVSGHNQAGLKYHLGSSGAPADSSTLYSDYPVMLQNALSLAVPAGVSKLVDYSPQTVNSQVQSSSATSDASVSHSELSNSSTIGSSQAQSNSYSTKVGLQGNAFALDVGHDKSATVGSDQNSTMGDTSGQSGSEDSSSSASMSIKDWGAYAAIDPDSNSPTWVFGQEYPWDIFACRAPWLTSESKPQKNPRNGAQDLLLVPSFMTERLRAKCGISSSYKITTLPPSQLSMYGYDFVMKAQWVITIPNGEDDTVTVSHALNGATASHAYEKSGNNYQMQVYVDKDPTSYVLSDGDLDVQLELGTMGLSPLSSKNVVGFVPANFVSPPTHVITQGVTPKPFSIFSNANTLLIKDTTTYTADYPVNAGYNSSSTALKATVMPNAPLTFTILFKVTDVDRDYSLHFKHWVTSGEAVDLKIVINGDGQNALHKTADALEGEGAENNLLDLTLRNQNFASVNYCDTLVMGLNSIDVTLTATTTNTAHYALRALAIQPG